MCKIVAIKEASATVNEQNCIENKEWQRNPLSCKTSPSNSRMLLAMAGVATATATAIVVMFVVA